MSRLYVYVVLRNAAFFQVHGVEFRVRGIPFGRSLANPVHGPACIAIVAGADGSDVNQAMSIPVSQFQYDGLMDFSQFLLQCKSNPISVFLTPSTMLRYEIVKFKIANIKCKHFIQFVNMSIFQLFFGVDLLSAKLLYSVN